MRRRSHFVSDNKSSHAGQCSVVPEGVAKCFKCINDDKGVAAKQKQKQLKLDIATSSLLPLPVSKTQCTISGQFAAQIGGKEAGNRAIARLFYGNAIPFNVADRKYFKEATKAVAARGPTYVPSGKIW